MPKTSMIRFGAAAGLLLAACAAPRVRVLPRPPMTTRLHVTALFLLLAASTTSLVACTSDAGAQDVIGEDESEHRTKPKGPDNGPGSVTVVAPPVVPGTTLASVTLWAQLTVQGALGVPFTGLRAGAFTLLLVSEDNNEAAYVASMQMNVAANEVKTIELGGITTRGAGGPATLGIQSGAVASITPNAPGLAISRLSFAAQATSAATKTTPVLPGEYVLSYGLADGVVANVQAGKSVSVDLRDYAQRRVARIVPAAKELPDACPRGAGMGTVIYGHSSRTEAMSFPLTEPTEVGVNDRIVAVRNALRPDYKLNLPCVTLQPRIELGALGAGPKDLKLGRLDVDDVEVTMGDGSKKTVRGTYRVFDATGTTMILLQQFPTNTGIDLPPGTYKVRVEYPQTAGTTGSFEETFTTP
jgi:hypothetical protein